MKASEFQAQIRQQTPAIVERLMVTKYGRRSASAADDAQYRRQIEVAVDAAAEVLSRYIQARG